MSKKSQKPTSKSTQSPPPTDWAVPKRTVELDFGEVVCLSGAIEFVYKHTGNNKYEISFGQGTNKEVVVTGFFMDLHDKLKTLILEMEQELIPPPTGREC